MGQIPLFHNLLFIPFKMVPAILSLLKRLAALKVDVKILTGDNEIITSYICKKQASR